MEEIYEMIKKSIEVITEEQKKVEDIANENREIGKKKQELEKERSGIDDKESNMYKARSKKIEKLEAESREKVVQMLEHEKAVKGLMSEKKSEILQKIAEKRRYVDENLDADLEGIDLKALQEEKAQLEKQIELNYTSREDFDKLSDEDKKAVRNAKEKYLLNIKRLREIDPTVRLLEILDGQSQESKYMELQSMERQVMKNFELENIDKFVEMVEKNAKPKQEAKIEPEKTSSTYPIIEETAEEEESKEKKVEEEAEEEELDKLDIIGEEEEEEELDKLDIIGEAEKEEEEMESKEEKKEKPVNSMAIIAGKIQISQINIDRYKGMLDNGIITDDKEKIYTEMMLKKYEQELKSAIIEFKEAERDIKEQEKAGKDISVAKKELEDAKVSLKKYYANRQASIERREKQSSVEHEKNSQEMKVRFPQPKQRRFDVPKFEIPKMVSKPVEEKESIFGEPKMVSKPVEEKKSIFEKVPENKKTIPQILNKGKEKGQERRKEDERKAQIKTLINNMFEKGRDTYLMNEALFELGYSNLQDIESLDLLNIRSAYRALKKDIGDEKLTIDQCRGILQDTKLEVKKEQGAKEKLRWFAEGADVNYLDSVMYLLKGKGINQLTDAEYENVWGQYRTRYLNTFENEEQNQITGADLEEIVDKTIKANRKEAVKNRMYVYKKSHENQEPKGLKKFFIKHDKIAKMLSMEDINRKLINQHIRIKARQEIKSDIEAMREGLDAGISQEQQARNAQIFNGRQSTQTSQTIEISRDEK